MPDTNTLKFNHALHLAGATIPTLNGKPLDCASCHQPDASGAFMQRVRRLEAIMRRGKGRVRRLPFRRNNG